MCSRAGYGRYGALENQCLARCHGVAGQKGAHVTLVIYSSPFAASAEDLFAFHLDASHLAAISPPIPRFELQTAPKLSELGDEQCFRLSIGPFGTTWRARITQVRRPDLIEDTQESGPFLRWRHQHRMAREGSGSRLTDVVAFRLLPTPAGEFLEYVLVRPGILAMFAWRHWKTRAALRG